MPRYTQKYTLAYLLKKLPDGFEYAREDWPPHVTLADVFAIEGGWQEVIKHLQSRLMNITPVESCISGEDRFGKDRTIPVQLIRKTNELQALHDLIIDILEAHDATFNSPEFTRDGFKPHSTIQKEGRLQPGDKIRFDSVTLIDLFPSNDPYQRRILGTIPLSRNTKN